MPRLKPRIATPLTVIGWREFVRFPRLKLGPILAKADTGARTSALHADEIRVSGRQVHFKILSDGVLHGYRAPLAGQKRIKSSNGHTENRPVIRVLVELDGQQFKTEMTLTDRTDMGVPVLLGRRSLKGMFLVNPARSFLLKQRKKPAP